MLQQIYQKTKGWFTWILFSLIAITFVFCGVEFRSKNHGKVIFQIGNEKLTEEVFRQKLEKYKSNLISQRGRPLEWTKEEEKRLERSFLDDFIEHARLTKTIEQMRLVLCDEQLYNEISKIPEFQQDGKFDLDRFQQYLVQNGLSIDSFKQLFGLNLGLRQQEFAIKDTEFLLPKEKVYLSGVLYQKRLVKIADLSKISADINISELDQRDYYKTHQTNFMDQAKVQFEYLILNSDDLVVKTVSDRDAEIFYQEHIDDYYVVPKRWQVLLVELFCPDDEKEQSKIDLEVSKIRLELAETDSVKEYPHIRTEKMWLTDGSFEGKLRNSLGKAKVGDVLPEIRDDKAVLLVKVLNIEEKRIRAFSEVRDQIVAMLKQRLIGEEFLRKSDQLAELVYNNPENLLVAAEQLNLKINQVTWCTKDEVFNKLGKIVADKVFDRTMLFQRFNSDLIEISPGKAMVLRVSEYLPAKPLAFEQVKGDIVKIMQEQREKDYRIQIAKSLIESKHDVQMVLNKQYHLAMDTKVFGENLENDALFSVVFSKAATESLFFEDPWLILIEKRWVDNSSGKDLGFSEVYDDLKNKAMNYLKNCLYDRQKVKVIGLED